MHAVQIHPFGGFHSFVQALRHSSIHPAMAFCMSREPKSGPWLRTGQYGPRRETPPDPNHFQQSRRISPLHSWETGWDYRLLWHSRQRCRSPLPAVVTSLSTQTPFRSCPRRGIATPPQTSRGQTANPLACPTHNVSLFNQSSNRNVQVRRCDSSQSLPRSSVCPCGPLIYQGPVHLVGAGNVGLPFVKAPYSSWQIPNLILSSNCRASRCTVHLRKLEAASLSHGR